MRNRIRRWLGLHKVGLTLWRYRNRLSNHEQRIQDLERLVGARRQDAGEKP